MKLSQAQKQKIYMTDFISIFPLLWLSAAEPQYLQGKPVAPL